MRGFPTSASCAPTQRRLSPAEAEASIADYAGGGRVGELARIRIHQESEPESGSENSTPIVPADIPAESRSLVQETAKAVYRALGCRGLSRVDMFLKEDGKVVLNEVNTLPGMTPYSRYPRMMAAAGLPLAEVIDRIVSLTLTEKADES